MMNGHMPVSAMVTGSAEAFIVGSAVGRRAELLLRSAGSRKIVQGAYPRKKEICTTADGDELRQARDAAAQTGFLRYREVGGTPATRYRLAIADQRIALVGQSGELGVHRPRVLQKLELTQDVRVETDELQPALRIVRRSRYECVLGEELGPVFAAAPQNAMKANGGHQIVSEASRAKTQHGDEFRNCSRASGVIGVARILAVHVRAERAALTHRIFGERKLVLPDLFGVGPDAGNGLFLHRHQWIAGSRAAHERGSQLVGLRGISPGLPVDELPEASDVLPQLAHHQIRSVATNILLVRSIFRGG